MYKYAARGLYEKDKFLYTILLSLKIDLERGSVKHAEFQSFIKGKHIIVYSLIFQIERITDEI